MSAQPSLFEQLREAHDEGRRFGTHTERAFCPYDEDTLRLWSDVGIPADLSTVEEACDMLLALWRKHEALKVCLNQLLAEAPK